VRVAWRRSLAGGALVVALATLHGARADAQQFSRSRWNTPTANDQTSTDGVFAVTVQNWPTNDVKLTLNIAEPPEGCAPTMTAIEDYPGGRPLGSTQDFSFAEGDAVCNGVYTATVEAQQQRPPSGDPQTVETLTLNKITVAVPAKPATDVKAMPTSGGSVGLSWTSGYGDSPAPPDFGGYQLYRVDRDNKREKILAHPIQATSYVDVDVPATGTYSYQVDAIRNGADPASAQSEDINVFVPGSSSNTMSGGQGGSQSSPADARTTDGAGASSPQGHGGQSQTGPRTQYFGTGPTLPADGTGDGQQAANLPSAGSVQIGRDDGLPGAGLAKPAAAALVAAVWAGLLLFFSRRAKHTARPDLQAQVEFEHVP
jgi:hypothetical protein